MPKIECFEISGLTCWFWSNDHDPPHFHIKRAGEWELKVQFLEDEARMFETVGGKTPQRKLLREIAQNVRENRARLLAEWEAKVNQ